MSVTLFQKVTSIYVNLKRNESHSNQKYQIDESNKDVTRWLKIDKNICRFKDVE